ncbi:polyketide synthase [Longimycelium tulufanense]|uniref:Polyketide synthase n=1 Tax=Longimycelium tulufanense TaxID=907463 RepID=A0A8J3CHI6_9PSEU|nr:3-oxoacyl-[acyl-carrier-protein] synthase III C-terminal domain-containing protein [Longimycelium tulufanense]GGM62394.1 polyketide synthase [Longimycelium tulufanense]
MSRVAAVQVALPPHRYTQPEVTAAVAGWCGCDDEQRALLEQLHRVAQVRTRHFTLPLHAYPGLPDADEAFLTHAVDLAEEAVLGALGTVGLGPADVDLLLTTSVTGPTMPAVDSLLAQRVGLRPDVKRIPMLGLGCAAGAAGLGRLHDYLRAWPDQVAVLLAVELCSLTLRPTDTSVPNLVASSLFGDATVAVVLVGDEQAGELPCRGPRVVATRSGHHPDGDRILGWNIGSSGFRMVLASAVPDLVERHLGEQVGKFLAEQGLSVPDVDTWMCQAGGPRVLQAVGAALDLAPSALELSWRSLKQVGNVSSASVLHVLGEAVRRPDVPAGSPGLLLAMCPGLGSELALLRW